MRKRLISLMMLMLLLAVLPLSVSAKELPGQSWSLVYDGKSLSGDYDNKAIADTIGNLQGGDSIKFTINLECQGEDTTEWYMSNAVTKSFEENSSAAGGSYDYVLTYISPDGTEVLLYNSKTVGGSTTDAGVSESELGLREASSSLENYFHLATMSNGDKASVTLEIMLDGEAAINDYMDTYADLNMFFAVEKTPIVTETVQQPDETVKGPDKTVKETDTHVKETKTVTREHKVTTNAPNTGDSTRLLLLCFLSLGSGLAMLILAIVILRRNRKEDEAA